MAPQLHGTVALSDDNEGTWSDEDIHSRDGVEDEDQNMEGSDGGSSDEGEPGGNQMMDYGQLNMVMQSRQRQRGDSSGAAGQQGWRDSAGERPRGGSEGVQARGRSLQLGRAGSGQTPHGLYRTVGGLNLFTSGMAGSGTAMRRSARVSRRAAVRDSQGQSIEDITALDSDSPTQPSAFRPVLQSPPTQPSQPRGAREGRQRCGSGGGTRREGAWTNSQLREAMACVDGGMSMKKASDMYHIPYSTFREWCYGIRRTRKRGPAAVLSPSKEQQLVDYCIRMCELGLGLTPTALKLKVYDITKSRPTPFRNGISG